MRFENVLYEVRGGVALVTLNRPNEANAMNLPLAQELAYVAMECDENPAVRAVLIRAAPGSKMFCAGGDLRAFADAGERTPFLLKEITLYLHAAISRFARSRVPVVAAVSGAAAGAGFSLAVSTDLAICGESAHFTMAYTGAGLTPDGSSTYFLPRIIGRRRTIELMMSNRRLSAAEALDWGLVNRVVPDAELAAEAEKLVETLARGPTEAFGLVKKLVLAEEGFEAQMELESRAIADAARTEDAKAAIAAFLSKSRATFQGR